MIHRGAARIGNKKMQARLGVRQAGKKGGRGKEGRRKGEREWYRQGLLHAMRIAPRTRVWLSSLLGER